MHPGPSDLSADAASEALDSGTLHRNSPRRCAAVVAATARLTRGGGTAWRADSSWQMTEGDIGEPPAGESRMPNSRCVRLRRLRMARRRAAGEPASARSMNGLPCGESGRDMNRLAATSASALSGLPPSVAGDAMSEIRCRLDRRWPSESGKVGRTELFREETQGNGQNLESCETKRKVHALSRRERKKK